MSSKVKRYHFDWIIENVTREKLENPNFNSTSNVFIIDYFGTLLECKIQFRRIQTPHYNYLAFVLNFKGHEDITFYVNISYEFGAKYDVLIARFRNNVEFPLSLEGDDESESLESIMQFVDEKAVMKIRVELAIRDNYKLNSIGEREKPTPKFYGDETFADFTLESSDGEKSKVHQVILAESSTFFYKLFTVDMKEKKLKTATFGDVNAKTLREVLRFIYTGSVEIDDYDFTKEVLYAAEKFALDGLKDICIKKFSRKINNRNVLDALVTAETFNAKELKDKCIRRIMRNFDKLEVQLSEEIPADKMAIMKKGAEAFNASKNDPQFIIKTTL